MKKKKKLKIKSSKARSKELSKLSFDIWDKMHLIIHYLDLCGCPSYHSNSGWLTTSKNTLHIKLRNN